MDIFTLAIWVGTLVFLGVSFARDKVKTKQALKMAFGMGKGMVANILSIIFAIGLILTILPPTEIASFVGNRSVLLATIAAALFGTVTLVPAFIAFPLVGTLVNAGVSVVPAVAFLTTLTMVGAVTIPLEKKEFGLKFTVIRNSLSFLFAIVIALVMGVMI
ncbi:permease [Lacrimispora defluvii]|uniref:Permease n=1 Tax=Lacrimispora defluvii TaxID=2719233 RepID=A0ABX1VWC8_9FIRM|nr:permease [Lacrimispora defluvii]NNJ32074.1 permease [Lacrimispora defluvii]